MPSRDRIDASLRGELKELVAERLRLGLYLIVLAMLASSISDHMVGGHRPVWADLMTAFGLALVGVSLWLLSQPDTRRRPVPLALAVVSYACVTRALTGIWFGEIAPTAIVCVLVALTAGATLPWGAWAQLVAAVVAGLSIATNVVFLPAPLVEAPEHFSAAVLIALTISVFLAIEVERHQVRLARENSQRRRAEAELARVNAQLEQRVAERTAELHESQKRLQDIVDNAAAVIHLKDAKGAYLLVNRHFETIFGRRREELIGKTPYDVFPAEIAAVLLANDRTVITSRQPLQIEEALQPRGEPRTFLSVKFPLIDSAGAIVGVCGISTDITERNRMDAELRRSEAALLALVENTTDAIWSIDRDGTVAAMNSVARRRYAARFGTPFDQGDLSPVPSRLSEEFHLMYARALAGEHIAIERSYEEADGLHQYLTALHPIITNGVVTGATVFSQDITERKRVEEQARQRQSELAHVLRVGTMGEMAAGLAHEINQPLGAIANYAQGSVRRLRSGTIDAPGVLPILEEIAREALRAGEIIRRLRDLVRKETPQQQAIDVNALVRESLRMIEADAHHFGIDVRLDLAPGLPHVTGDGIQLEQVLLNLLRNGVEAVQAAENGERTVAVRTTAHNGAVEVIIRDTGIGIPAPPADVFAPFFSTKASGLGMGLSISRSIVEAHGGQLSAARNPDHGSTFRMTLPLNGAD